MKDASLKVKPPSLLKGALSEGLWNLPEMATAPQKMKVKILEGEMLAVAVAPTNTVKELRAMLLESKRCEDSIERQFLRVEVLTAGLLIDDDQTVESAGLLCAESGVTVVYARREVEAATKEGIHEEGPLSLACITLPESLTVIEPCTFLQCTVSSGPEIGAVQATSWWNHPVHRHKDTGAAQLTHLRFALKSVEILLVKPSR